VRESGGEPPHSTLFFLDDLGVEPDFEWKFTSDWPHSPLHRLEQGGTYIVTAATYGREPLFRR
jgi:hypothetical protein